MQYYCKFKTLSKPIWRTFQYGDQSKMADLPIWRPIQNGGNFTNRQRQCRRAYSDSKYLTDNLNCGQYIRVDDIWGDYHPFLGTLPRMIKHVSDFTKHFTKQRNQSQGNQWNIKYHIETNNTIKYNELQYKRGKGLEGTDSGTGYLLCLMPKQSKFALNGLNHTKI